MNEQLIVKNFGPIKDATVDFKRVTVFIGPTGGGKSTLAKLAAIFRDGLFLDDSNQKDRLRFFKKFLIDRYFQPSSIFRWLTADGDEIATDKELKFDSSTLMQKSFARNREKLGYSSSKIKKLLDEINKEINELPSDSPYRNKYLGIHAPGFTEIPPASSWGQELVRLFHSPFSSTLPFYILSERTFVSAIEYSWAGLMSEKIGLPGTLVDFINNLLQTKQALPELEIPFLKVKYLHQNGQDFIKTPDSEILFRLNETASGIQSVTPLLVLLEHLSRNTEQAQSFIIEEPELNLYPTAQQGLLNWLVEKFTKGENDLTITTHSPYILSHLNLMLYAYQVAEKHPDQKAAIAAIVPEASWINPKEFACYQVEGGGVHSLVDAELGLIDNNALDNISGDKADAFDQLININRGFAHA